MPIFPHPIKANFSLRIILDPLSFYPLRNNGNLVSEALKSNECF